MTDNEKIQSFGDMVDATDKMSAPWRETVFKLVKALVITNLFWAIVLGAFIWFAYMTPVEMEQGQQFDQQTQSQSYSEGVTNGG